MAVRYFYLFILISLFTGLFFIGDFLGRNVSRKKAILIGAFALVFCFSEVLFKYRPDLEMAIFAWKDYIFFKQWGIGAAFFLFGIALPFTSKRNQKAVKIFMIFLLLLKIKQYSNFFVVLPEFKEIGMQKGVCLQSTDYTCVPASCVTLLAGYDIHATENEMAELCVMWGEEGAFPIHAVRGLKLKLGNAFNVKIAHLTWERLLEKPFPVIVTVKWKPRVDHSVAILIANKEEVIVGDPLIGPYSLTKEEFLCRWKFDTIWIEKNH